MKNKILLISDLESVEATLQTHKFLIKQILKKTKIFFIDKNLRNIDIKNYKYKFNLNKNFKFLNLRKFVELKDFLKNNNLIIWNNFGFSLKNFIIHLIIKKTQKKQIVISNLGNIQWSLNFSKENFLNSYFKFMVKKISKFIFILAIKFKVIDKIETRFQSGKKKKFHRNNLFVKNYRYINSQFYDEYLNKKLKKKEEFITHIDLNPNHEDDVVLRGKLSDENIKKHYLNLNKHLKKLKKIFKKKIVICIHPLYDLKKTKKFFPDFPVYKYKTRDFIEKSFLITFFDSSIIFNAVFLRKKIMILRNEDLGESMYKKSLKYENLLNIPFINLSDKKNQSKKNLLKKFNNSKNKIIKYIKYNMISDNKTPGYKEILEFINNA